ncbi:MAG: TolC family protein, partial [Desulfobacteraceae bacterium]|nr:TolC family protein [Desulfobacteraceae bacterium]
MTENKTRDLFGGVKLMAPVMVAAALLALTSCAAVGPDYTPPAPEAPAAWNTVLETGMTADPADAEILAKCWTEFDDPVLSGLISQAAGGNLDLKQAESRIREARARRGVAKAGFFPTLDTSGSYTKRYSSNTTNDFYRAGFDAGWEIDIFGGTRR